MKKLKKSIIWAFVATLVLLSVGKIAVDFLFEEMAIPYYGLQGEAQMLTTVSVYLIVSLALIAAAAWNFARMIGKKFEAEMKRQGEERNMLYANIAHDLKTPMTSILGYARALGDKKVEPEQTEIVAERIYRKAKQTDELLNTLFEYTKLQTESYPLNKTETDICALVRQAAAGEYEAFEEKNIQLEVEIPEEKIPVLCDVKHMARAVGNLITNACEHNEVGGHVEIAVRKKAGRIFIIIADDGRDISGKEAELIFEPFISGDPSGNSPCGSGLGLAIARRIVEKHKGKLYIEHQMAGCKKEFVIELAGIGA